MSWLVVLLGAGMTFYLQHPEQLRPDNRAELSGPESPERLALECAIMVGSRFLAGRPPIDLKTLTADLHTAPHPLDHILTALCAEKILIRLCTECPAFMPARPLDSILVSEILSATRSHGRRIPPDSSDKTDRIMTMWANGARNGLGNLTLAELLTEK